MAELFAAIGLLVLLGAIVLTPFALVWLVSGFLLGQWDK